VRTFAITDVKKIETIHDGGYGLTHPIASATIRDRVYFYNGLGVRSSTASLPPFSVWDVGMAARPMGIDIWCPNGLPTATFQVIGTGSIQIQEHRQLWVGLHNALTGHYSNAVLVGKLGAQAGAGQINVSGLSKITVPPDAADRRDPAYTLAYAQKRAAWLRLRDYL